MSVAVADGQAGGGWWAVAGDINQTNIAHCTLHIAHCSSISRDARRGKIGS